MKKFKGGNTDILKCATSKGYVVCGINYTLHVDGDSNTSLYNMSVSPTILYGVEKGYIPSEIKFTHMVEQQEIKEIYSQEELEILLKNHKEMIFVIFEHGLLSMY